MNHAGCRGVVARCEPWTLDRPWCVKVGGVREHQSEFGGHPISRSPAVYPPILSFCGRAIKHRAYQDKEWGNHGGTRLWGRLRMVILQPTLSLQG